MELLLKKNKISLDLQKKNQSYNYKLTEMGCESSIDGSMVIEVKKQPQNKQGSITTYPSIQDLVRKEKRKQLANNMKLWADKKAIFRKIHNEVK